jgi:hypothetical protein
MYIDPGTSPGDQRNVSYLVEYGEEGPFYGPLLPFSILS